MKTIGMLIAVSLSFAACSKKEAKNEEPPTKAPTEVAAGDPAKAPEDTSAPEETKTPAGDAKRVSVTVTGAGYEPANIEAKAGEPLTLVFKRTTEEGCGNKLVFPDRDIEHDLPLNEEVEVTLTPEESETIAFTCGMGMYKGSIVVAEG